MLPTLTERPFSNPEWLFEPKLDGVRAITLIRDGKIKLLSRSGLDPTHQYPSLVEELKRQAGRELALDGEIVAFDEQGRPSFQRVQQRLGLTRPEDIRRAEAETPVVYYVFDLLHLDGYDLRGSPLDQRKELLKNVLVPSEHVRLVEHFTTEGEAAYEAAVEHGLEGLVAKCRKSAYESGRRSRQWLKIKKTRSDDFVVGGFSQGLGGRSDTFGALLVGYYDQTGKLIFAGQVGTGFDDKLLADLKKRLESLRTPECPFTPRPPLKGPTTWVRPELVAEVKYVQWTQDGRLRAPVFLRLREDKPPAEATGLEIVATPEEVEAPAETDRPVAQDDIASILEQLQSASNKVVLEAQGRKVPISNLDRIFWPPFGDQRALTKRDLLAYLAQSAPHYLSHLRDRPLSLIRFPGGIQGERFFQKHWEHNLPRFVETVSLYSDHNVGDGEYMLCNNLPTLLWLGQIAALELHTWYSRVDPEPDGHHLPANFAGSPENIRSSLLNYPDFLIFDLDPYIYSGQEGKGEEPELNRAAFAKTCDIALSLKDILDGLSLSSFVKLSGRTGLHIFVSILRQLPYEATRSVAETVGRFLLNQRPKEVTMEWAVQKRSGKIFFDHNQNVRGKTVASIYSPRSAPEATVSMPLRWDEVGKIYPTDFTILTAPERLRQVGDVWQGILDAKHDLQALLDIPDEAKTPPEPPKRRRKASAQAGPSP